MRKNFDEIFSTIEIDNVTGRYFTTIPEEIINELPYEKDTLKTLFAIKEQEIFKNYKVTEELYRSSYSHYFFNPEELDDIYRVVIDSLSLYQQTKQKHY